MAAARMSMRKIREALRLHFQHGLGRRAIGRILKKSPTTIGSYLAKAGAAGLSWPLAADLDDGRLEAMLFPPQDGQARERAKPDFDKVHKELRRKGVTLQLLWQEYKVDHSADGYQYTQFCNLYRVWRQQVDVVMRQNHHAGEKAFVDYSGDGIEYLDPITHEVQVAQLFVMVLGASNYTYVEPTRKQDLRDWVMAHARGYEYFGGVPAITVPDNPRTAVTRPCLYEPDLNPTYQDLAEHYGTAIIPARPRKPRDKAKVENAVLVAQRWIVAELRDQTLVGFEDVRRAVATKLEEINTRPFQKLDGTRRELFEELDRPALQPLPSRRFEYGEWSKPKVNIDYHIEVDKHYYSVPYQLAGKHVDARVSLSTVEVYHQGVRVASHERSRKRHQATTQSAHMPASHRKHLEWTPSRIKSWAGKTGPMTAAVVEQIMASRPHPEQGYRSCLGILRLGKKHGDERLEAACGRAVAINSYSYRSVKSILEAGLEHGPLEPGAQGAQSVPVRHQNIRGADYYN